MRDTHNTTLETRASVPRHPAAGTRIRVSSFRPFASRHPNDPVLRLDFSYNAATVNLLKALIRKYKAAAVNVSKGRLRAGGFLNRSGCWFIEPVVWSEVKHELEQAGCQVVEVHDEQSTR